MRRLVLFLTPIGIGAVLIMGAYGFMAHNTVSSQSIGSGSNDINGYAVQLLHVDATLPPSSYIHHIQFTMDPAPHTVQVWFEGGSGILYSNQGGSPACFVSSGDVVDCFIHESYISSTAMHVAGAD